jgi:hypothetical protein
MNPGPTSCNGNTPDLARHVLGEPEATITGGCDAAGPAVGRLNPELSGGPPVLMRIMLSALLSVNQSVLLGPAMIPSGWQLVDEQRQPLCEGTRPSVGEKTENAPLLYTSLFCSVVLMNSTNRSRHPWRLFW